MQTYLGNRAIAIPLCGATQKGEQYQTNEYQLFKYLNASILQLGCSGIFDGDKWDVGDYGMLD